MDRRTLLAQGLAGASVAVCGCLSQLQGSESEGTEPDLPDGMDVETAYTNSRVLQEDWLRDFREERTVLLSDAETASERIEAVESAIESFVADVDFDRAYLLLVQNAMQSTPDLVLSSVQRTDRGIHVDVTIDHPGYDVSDDLTGHTLLVAIDDEVSGPCLDARNRGAQQLTI